MKNNTNVSADIDFMILVRGKPNMDFQCPKRRVPKVAYFDQGGDLTNEGCIDGDNMESGQASFEMAFPALCVGECILSLKQLLQSYMYMMPNINNPTWGTFQTLYLPPLGILVQRYQNVAGVYGLSTSSTWLTDKISTIGSCYLYMRGSMRYVATTTTTTLQSAITDYVPATAAPALSTTNDIISAQTNQGYFMEGAFASNPMEASNIVRDPYYNKYPVTLTRPTYTQSQSWSSLYGPNHSIVYCSNSNMNLTNGSIILQRAVGDDFQFSFWLGVPTLIITA